MCKVTLWKVVGDLQLRDKKVTTWITWYLDLRYSILIVCCSLFLGFWIGWMNKESQKLRVPNRLVISGLKIQLWDTVKSFAICRSIDVRKCRTASLSFWFWFSLKFRMSRSDSLSHPYLLLSFGTFLLWVVSRISLISLHQSPHRNTITDSTFIVELFFWFFAGGWDE